MMETGRRAIARKAEPATVNLGKLRENAKGAAVYLARIADTSSSDAAIIRALEDAADAAKALAAGIKLNRGK